MDDLSKRYREFLTKARVPNVEEMARYTETHLPQFIREYADVQFTDIYSETHRGYYDNIRNEIATNAAMRQADQKSGGELSRALKFYSEFLQSKFFPQPKAPKQRKAKNAVQEEEPAAHTEKKLATTTRTPRIVEREETEGERKHVEFERSHRNPILRRRCIERWGYCCQVCGIDMEQIYGELGKDFIEVHHLKPISTYDESRPDDYVDNLVPLCPNCHAMIHHGTDGPLTLKQLREAYKGTKYKITEWKED